MGPRIGGVPQHVRGALATGVHGGVLPTFAGHLRVRVGRRAPQAVDVRGVRPTSRRCEGA